MGTAGWSGHEAVLSQHWQVAAAAHPNPHRDPAPQPTRQPHVPTNHPSSHCCMTSTRSPSRSSSSSSFWGLYWYIARYLGEHWHGDHQSPRPFPRPGPGSRNKCCHFLCISQGSSVLPLALAQPLEWQLCLAPVRSSPGLLPALQALTAQTLPPGGSQCLQVCSTSFHTYTSGIHTLTSGLETQWGD